MSGCGKWLCGTPTRRFPVPSSGGVTVNTALAVVQSGLVARLRVAGRGS